VTLGIILSASVFHAFTEISWWKITAGNDRMIEFLSEDIKLFCYNGCEAYTVAGRPDEIYVLSIKKYILKRLLSGEKINGPFQKVYVLNLQSRTLAFMELNHFLKLDIIFEDLSVRRYDHYPEIKFAGNLEGHDYVAPIQRNDKEFVLALSSVRKTSEKITFGIPGIIPFFGRSGWFQTEESHKGTFLLEIFDRNQPSKPPLTFLAHFSHRLLGNQLKS